VKKVLNPNHGAQGGKGAVWEKPKKKKGPTGGGGAAGGGFFSKNETERRKVISEKLPQSGKGPGRKGGRRLVKTYPRAYDPLKNQQESSVGGSHHKASGRKNI